MFVKMTLKLIKVKTVGNSVGSRRRGASNQLAPSHRLRRVVDQFIHSFYVPYIYKILQFKVGVIRLKKKR